jgi:hypothetical protein
MENSEKIWSDEIHKWLLSDPAYGIDIKKLKSRRIQLATDKRLVKPAIKIEKISPHPRRVIAFLEIATGLPESFAYFKDKSPNFRLDGIKKLHKGTKAYLSLFKEHRDLVEFYLQPELDDLPREVNRLDLEIRQAKSAVDSISGKLELIESMSAKGIDFLPKDVIPRLSRKKNIQNAEKVYCLRQLCRNARVLFNKPLYAEVGLIVSICLGMKFPIDPDEVRDFCRGL